MRDMLQGVKDRITDGKIRRKRERGERSVAKMLRIEKYCKYLTNNSHFKIYIGPFIWKKAYLLC